LWTPEGKIAIRIEITSPRGARRLGTPDKVRITGLRLKP